MAICNLCQKDKPEVFYMRMRVGPIVDVLPQEKGKTGICQSCLQFVGKKLSKNRSYVKIGGGKIYVAPNPAALPTVAEELEAKLLYSGVGTEPGERSSPQG